MSVRKESSNQPKPGSSFSQDAEHVRFAMNAASIGVWEVELSTNTVIWDDRCREFFGLETNKLLSYEQAISFIHPDDMQRVDSAVQAALHGENKGRYDVTYRTNGGDDGKLRWVVFSGHAYFDAEGRAQRFGGIAQDITERVLAEQTYREKLVSAQLITEAAVKDTNTGVYRFNLKSGESEYTPQFALALTGSPSLAGALRDEFVRHLHPDDLHMRDEALKTGMATGSFTYVVRAIWNNGSIHQLRIVGAFINDVDGKPLTLIGTVRDTTRDESERQAAQEAQAKLHTALQVSETRFRNLFEQSPMAIGLLSGREMIIQVGNDKIFEVWGKDSSITGLPLLEALPEIKGQHFMGLLERVYDTGKPYFGIGVLAKLVRHGSMEEVYFDFTYTAVRNDTGIIDGVMVLATEVTEREIAKKAIEKSELLLRNMVLQAPMAICIYRGDEFVIEVANDRMFEFWGRPAAEVMQKPLFVALPEAANQGYEELLTGVMQTGETFSATELPVRLQRDGTVQTVFINFTYEPMREPDGRISGIMAIATDVTDQVHARNILEETTNQMRAMIEVAPFPIGVYIGRELRIRFANQSIKDVWGKGDDVEGKLYTDILPELATQEIFQQLSGVYDSGIAFHSGTRRVDIEHKGQLIPYYFNYSFTPLFDADSKVYGVMNTAADVTALETARQQLEESEAAQRNAVELAELGTWVVDVFAGTTQLSQRHADIFGLDSCDISYQQGLDIVHPEDRKRVGEAFARAMAPGSDGRYEAEYRIINVTSGNRQIIHAQGQTTFDKSGKPLRITGTARDITIQRELQTALENEVQQRTEELRTTNDELADANRALTHTNEELAQYAYVASHDLQEPLRKIQVFTTMLNSSKSLDAKNTEIAGKISQSAGRMQYLIRDLLEFSRLLNSETLVRPVALSEIVAAVVSDYELTIADKQASITVEELPVIQCVSLQMNQLFNNLLGNALKFSLPDVSPVVSIQSIAVSDSDIIKWIPKPLPFAQYHHIIVSDNGIGFEVQYKEQIFEVFKRLHGRDTYSGSGIGLAICKRIVSNHQGVLFAESTMGKGSTFHIILPDRQTLNNLLEDEKEVSNLASQPNDS